MDIIRYPSPTRPGDLPLLVMLPGFGIEPAEFAERGFIQAAWDMAGPLDIIAARPALDGYLAGTVAEEIERKIVAPERADGRTRLWLLGLSLGGMGALLHARSYPGVAEGVILIAPFLGTPGTVAEIGDAGGLALWQPGCVAGGDGERQMLAWLKDFLVAMPPRPALYLGYGRTDRFAKGHALLGERLPEGRVVRDEGGHDWATWTSLWRQLLTLRPFSAERR
jgi:pimeloyl-ACP methyl ester carboxylesterase